MSTGITPLTPEQEAAQKTASLHEGYVLRNLVALDKAANVATGGLSDETFSSRMARSAQHHQVLGELVSKMLDVFEQNHGSLAQAGDLARAEQVIAVEKASGDVQ